jgi:hypothetical protein
VVSRKYFLALPPPFRRGFAEARADEVLLLKPVQRGIDARDGDLVPGLLLDFPRDRHPVGVLSQAHDGETNILQPRLLRISGQITF